MWCDDQLGEAGRGWARLGEGDHLHFNYFTTATAPLQPPLSMVGYIVEDPPSHDHDSIALPRMPSTFLH